MNVHELCVNTIKGLAIDGVQAAKSGHPGMPLGAADMATVLWRQFLVHDPEDPSWPDRDRFVLSAGHGSMLLYSLLHLSGYDLSLDDLKRFRQWGSKTPGHPEYGHTPGVETTTGPLGQGFANGVGMAIAERYLRERFSADLVDHRVYGIVGDGDLMEGVASEAASLAGHLRLGRLIYLYDDNEITIDGRTDLAFGEDRGRRFEAYGWHVQHVNGHDADAIAAAIEAARSETERPSLICCRTVIGQGTKLAGTSKVHGAPLGADEVAATKARLGLDPSAHFVVPADAAAAFRAHDGPARRAAWQARLDAHPETAEFLRWLAADPAEMIADIAWPAFPAGGKIATRKASEAALKAIVAKHPFVLGGSADLAESNGTHLGRPALAPTGFAGAGSVAFGVREHAMGAICNGMALHGGFVPYGATFLVFHDYMRPSVRLSALMGLGTVWIYTHDSIFLGEDGPTHQPVETLLALRSIPGLETWRPADATETSVAWQQSLLRRNAPTALVLTRQNLPIFEAARTADAVRGGYVIHDVDAPQVVLVATGSEVATALSAAELLAAEGVRARVVSMPCVERFFAQDAHYRVSVLPIAVPRVTIEAGVTLGWERIIGVAGASIGIDRFGASAPAEVLAEKFGFTPENIARVAREQIR